MAKAGRKKRRRADSSFFSAPARKKEVGSPTPDIKKFPFGAVDLIPLPPPLRCFPMHKQNGNYFGFRDMGKEDTHPTFRLRENEMKFRYCKTAAVVRTSFCPLRKQSTKEKYAKKTRKIILERQGRHERTGVSSEETNCTLARKKDTS